ncbi:hypothetical protein TVAG_188670 [Trichomonas vaginalis G3]|uniref:Uncharacterized protein n=1 Tax=Trichomonas vaginalis (strain ATCC PRA-98 / G3) TaxID=412133 RepID=A2EEY2_TRIV3|nr:hypothetical protein TVAGG3_0471930 [Trichomonas vaginalis G3]EAY08780.1 hypothetical protein TVAG_188670 [Trichomonas vaginalis G3]KAI5515124.1 hypothetical protein TVAGG3_0471930 [Trichomonas vaginalis G3]|eukprot:XP_001321003.1 hypothetical protein [Trichomonas vaginalis G3]
MSKNGEFFDDLKRIFDVLNSQQKKADESNQKTKEDKKDSSKSKIKSKKQQNTKPKQVKKKQQKPKHPKSNEERLPAEDITASVITHNFALFIAEKNCLHALNTLQLRRTFKLWKSNLRKSLIQKTKQEKRSNQDKTSATTNKKQRSQQMTRNDNHRNAEKTDNLEYGEQQTKERQQVSRKTQQSTKANVERVDIDTERNQGEVDDTVNFLIQAFNRLHSLSESGESTNTMDDTTSESTNQKSISTPYQGINTTDTFGEEYDSSKAVTRLESDDIEFSHDSAPEFAFEDSSSNITISGPLHFDSSQINSSSQSSNSPLNQKYQNSNEKVKKVSAQTQYSVPGLYDTVDSPNSNKSKESTPKSQKSQEDSSPQTSPIVKQLFSPTQRKSRVDELNKIIEQENKAKSKQNIKPKQDVKQDKTPKEEKKKPEAVEEEESNEEEEISHEEEEEPKLITSSISTDDLSSENADQSETQNEQKEDEEESEKLYDTDDITFTDTVTDSINTSDLRFSQVDSTSEKPQETKSNKKPSKSSQNEEEEFFEEDEDEKEDTDNLGTTEHILEDTVNIEETENQNEEEDFDDSFSFTSSGTEEENNDQKKKSKFVDPVLCKGKTMEQFALDDSGFTNDYSISEETDETKNKQNQSNMNKKEKSPLIISESDENKKVYETTSDDFVPNYNNFLKPKSHHQKVEENKAEEESINDSFEFTSSDKYEEEEEYDVF